MDVVSAMQSRLKPEATIRGSYTTSAYTFNDTATAISGSTENPDNFLIVLYGIK